jgi:rubredoxin
MKCHRCGYVYPAELGRYGCPNCHGDGLKYISFTLLTTQSGFEMISPQ